jgi:hypothetical protein
MSTPLTLTEFNNDFAVRIVDFVDMGNNTNKVVFEVKCTVNNRVGVFISEIDTTTLDEGFTNDDVVDAAWNEVKTDANDWAVVNLPKVVYTAYTVESVSDNSPITLQNFNNNFTVELRRYALYPEVSPKSWCLGFYVYKTNNTSINMYVDNNVPIGDFCNNVLCASVGASVWNLVKSNVCVWAASQLEMASVIDTTYVPTAV